MEHSNPYIAQVMSKGYSESEARQVSPSLRKERTFPCTIGGRVFDTQAEYDDALADFLNGI